MCSTLVILLEMILTHSHRYFSSRPELLSGLGGGSSSANSTGAGIDKKAAYSAVHSALASNPEATASLVSAGLKHGSQNSNVKNSPFASAVRTQTIVSFLDLSHAPEGSKSRNSELDR